MQRVLNVFSCTDEQPEDFFDYYGFSTYARESNELTPELEAVLPPTDTRFRPDQRFRAFCLFLFFKMIRKMLCLGFKRVHLLTLSHQAPGAGEGRRGR